MNPRWRKAATTGVLCALMLSATFARASHREYVAYCATPEGTRFVLRAKYEYSHLAVGRSPIRNQESWQVYFVDKRKKETPAPSMLQFTDPTVVPCSEIGVLNGVPVVNMSYRTADGNWFDSQKLPDNLTMSTVAAERNATLNGALKLWQVAPFKRFGLVVPHGARLVFEQPLYSVAQSRDGVIQAVYKSSSMDNGATWTSPQISKAAENFDIGKSPLEQRYAARPLPGGTVGHNGAGR